MTCGLINISGCISADSATGMDYLLALRSRSRQSLHNRRPSIPYAVKWTSDQLFLSFARLNTHPDKPKISALLTLNVV